MANPVVLGGQPVGYLRRLVVAAVFGHDDFEGVGGEERFERLDGDADRVLDGPRLVVGGEDNAHFDAGRGCGGRASFCRATHCRRMAAIRV